jgi:putative ABC transport system permease protein
MLLAVVGLLCGIAGAFAAGRIMATLLNEAKPFEPVFFAATTAGIAAVALLACYNPALRAARLNPMTALRYE